MLKKCFLTDDEYIHNTAHLSTEELEQKQAEAHEMSNGAFKWVDEEAIDLPYSPTYRHISREDMALTKQGK
ncbi:MAG: hypothetical protein KME29_04640 [Calothrix sp. FI2-JRJ7]|jgi:hypothetical protein|nr:hypothetical protein [Calothrix sp. FI2-JRJ7]